MSPSNRLSTACGSNDVEPLSARKTVTFGYSRRAMLVRQRTSASLLSREKTTMETWGMTSRSSLMNRDSGGRRAPRPEGPVAARGAGSGDLLQRLDDRGVGALLGDVVQHHAADDALSVDHDGRAVVDPLLLEFKAVLLRHGPLGLEVGEQRVLDAELLGECLVRPDRVHAHAEDARVQRVELLEIVDEAGVLLRADRAEVERIEREDHLVALQIRELVLLVVVGLEREVGGLFTRFDRHESIPPGTESTALCFPRIRE